jgi:hypothetical protein
MAKRWNALSNVPMITLQFFPTPNYFIDMFKLLLRGGNFIVKSRQEAVLALALFEKAPPQKVL